MDELQQIIGLVQAGGVLLLLILALLGAYRRWYVFRPEFDDERRDKEEWKAIALDALGALRDATSVAERTSRQAAPQQPRTSRRGG